MPFSTVLFDLDGTLIDTNTLIVRSFQAVLKAELGLDISQEELYRYFGEPLPLTMARFAPDRAEHLCTAYRTFNEEQHDLLIAQFEGVHAMVEDLKQAGIRLAVVTSKRTPTARRGLQVSNLEHWFETVVGLDETEHHKPSPEPALLALKRLGVDPGPHVLMVGDSKFDILCGRNAGLKTAAVGWTVQDRTALAASLPDFWVDHPRDLIGLVLG